MVLFLQGYRQRLYRKGVLVKASLLPCRIEGELDAPLIATAIHAGHEVRAEVAALLALEPAERLREEDPYTDGWTAIAPQRIVGTVSRFEVDLNRPRDGAVYMTPEQAWGLRVWREALPAELLARSLERYDSFYDEMRRILRQAEQHFRHFVVLDLHSYNHRREGAGGPPADPELNPHVIVGTSNLDRARWTPVVDRLISELQTYDYPTGRLNVRENVKFSGGHFPRWINSTSAGSACALAIEFKKFFMDEWTGEPDEQHVQAIERALIVAAAAVLEELERL